MSNPTDFTERKGRSKGGTARAEKLSPEERSEIASKGAAAKRANASLPRADHIGNLPIGEIILFCAVLSDKTRLISEFTIKTAFGPATGGSQKRKQQLMEDSGVLPLFLVADSLQPFISQDLRTLVSNPIKYKVPSGGLPRIGYEATVLPKLCEVWLKAREAGALTNSQQPIASKAEILIRALANTGIIALIDEVTGYQSVRAKDALVTILEAFIAKELQPWVKTFPDEFYEHLFRLRGLNYLLDSVKRPQYFGYLTNDIIYNRLAPGVLLELKKVTPKNDSGKSKAKMFQSLTSNTGYPKLREHLGKVIAYMQISKDYSSFMYKMDRFLPVHGETLPLQFEAEFYEDEGI